MDIRLTSCQQSQAQQQSVLCITEQARDHDSLTVNRAKHNNCQHHPPWSKPGRLDSHAVNKPNRAVISVIHTGSRASQKSDSPTVNRAKHNNSQHHQTQSKPGGILDQTHLLSTEPGTTTVSTIYLTRGQKVQLTSYQQSQ
jgi:hypothetical protein